MPISVRSLGASGIAVSALGFGGWAIGGQSRVGGYGPTEDDVSHRAIQAALDAGCTLFDTAGCYGEGRSERLLGQVLGPCRDRVVLMTKVGIDFSGMVPRQDFSPRGLRVALEDGLHRLQSEYADIVLLHDPPVQVVGRGDVREVMAEFRARGVARAVGVSVAHQDDLPMVLAEPWVEVVQLPYNVLTPVTVDGLLKQAAVRGTGLVGREPLLRGMITGRAGGYAPGDHRALWPDEVHQHLGSVGGQLTRYRVGAETIAQVALRYALACPSLSSVLVGCRTPEQVTENFILQ